MHLPMQEMQDMWVQSLDWKGPLEEEVGTHFPLALENPMDRGAW